MQSTSSTGSIASATYILLKRAWKKVNVICCKMALYYYATSIASLYSIMPSAVKIQPTKCTLCLKHLQIWLGFQECKNSYIR